MSAPDRRALVEPIICIIMRPAGVVVSIFSVIDWKPAPAWAIRSMITGRKSGAEMAHLYNVSQPTVSRIVAQHRMVSP